MLPIQLWTYIAVALVPTVRSLNTTAQDQLPLCAQTCQNEVLLASLCEVDLSLPTLNDTAECYCSDKGSVYDTLTSCVQNSCTLEELLTWQKTRAKTCGIRPRDIDYSILYTCCILFTFTTIFCVGRLLSRSKQFGGPGFWWDDWAILCLYVVAILQLSIVIELHGYNSGVDSIGSTVSDIHGMLLWYYISEPFYFAGTYGSKLVFSLLYLRMWKTKGPIRYACWAMVVASISGIFFFSLSALLVRWPWAYYYGDSAIVRNWVMGIYIPATVYGFAAINILADFYVLLLPILMLQRLPGLSRARKIGISVIFLVGFVTTAVSLVRVKYIKPVINSTNVPWDFGVFELLCQIEIHFSIICANTPTWTGLVRRTIKRFNDRRMVLTSASDYGFDTTILSSEAAMQETRTSTYNDEAFNKEMRSVESGEGETITALPDMVIRSSLQIERMDTKRSV